MHKGNRLRVADLNRDGWNGLRMASYHSPMSAYLITTIGIKMDKNKFVYREVGDDRPW